MSVLVSITSPLDAATYDGMISHHTQALRSSAGFQIHFARPNDAGWRVEEIWDSKDAHAAWFDATIRPNLPAGVEPTYTELHNVVA